jgi:hypothetical protein
MLRLGQVRAAKKYYERGIREIYVDSPFGVKRSAKKLVEIRCP